MNLTVYIVDDEFHAIDILRDYIARTPGLELLGFSTSSTEALQAMTTGPVPNLLLADIDMPELNGLELSALVRPQTQVIFTTSFREYAPEAFDHHALDYLLKPIAFHRFTQCIQKARTAIAPVLAAPASPGFFVKTGIKGKFQKVMVDEIISIECLENYLRINRTTEPVIAHLSFPEILKILPADRFTRIHKSYVINLHRIAFLEPGQVKLDNGTTLPIGRAYRENLFRLLNASMLISKKDSSNPY